MKTRIRAMVLTLVATCALCCSLPSPAYALNLDNYSDSIWTRALERGTSVGEHFISYGIQKFNTDWAALGQSPAFQAAMQSLQADYIRGIYFTLSDLYEAYTINHNTVAQISTNVTTIGTLIWQIQPVIDDIKDDLDDVLDNQLAIGTALGNINNFLSTINTAVTNPVAIWNTHGLTSSTTNSLGYRLEAIYSTLEDISILIGDLSDGVAAIGTYVDYTHSDLQYMIQNGIEISNWPQSSVDLSTVESYLLRIVNVIEQFEFNSYSGYRYLLTWLPWTNSPTNTGAPWVSVRYLSNYINQLNNTLLDGFASIQALLQAGNVSDAVGDFDDVEFDANVDTLTSRIATLAPFGAVLMVAAELDMLQTQAVATPEMDLDFDFAGFHQVVHIDLSYLDTVQPFINWLVIILLVYNLLWYTVDFVKLEAAS